MGAITLADVLCIFKRYLALRSCFDNTPPVVTDDEVTTGEDAAVTIAVLSNDSDVDTSATLAIIAFDNPSAQGGRVTVNNDGYTHLRSQRSV